MDFRSPMRSLAGVQDNFSPKGTISDQGEKKQAFYILQKTTKKNLGKPEWIRTRLTTNALVDRIDRGRSPPAYDQSLGSVSDVERI
jgi:hypothetical protein